jgi:hypothetical protein
MHPGNFSITLDPGPGFNGDYTLDGWAMGFISFSLTLNIPDGATVHEKIILVAQGILAGHVKSAQGPIGGAKVTVGSASAFADVTGTYSIMVDPGQYNAIASAPGFTPMSLPVLITSGATLNRDFVLSATVPGSITGTVTDDNGDPFGRARIAVSDTDLTTTDADGKYALNNLQPGPTQVEASFGPHFVPDKETITVISGQTVTQDFILVRKGQRQ